MPRGEHPNSRKNLSLGVKSPNIGRPPKNYSIARALERIASEPESIDDKGNPINKAQMAARWMWKVALDPTAPFRDRMDAAKFIVSRLEPEYKLSDRNFRDEDDESQLPDLDGVSDEELKQAEAALMRIFRK